MHWAVEGGSLIMGRLQGYLALDSRPGGVKDKMEADRS